METLGMVLRSPWTWAVLSLTFAFAFGLAWALREPERRSLWACEACGARVVFLDGTDVLLGNVITCPKCSKTSLWRLWTEPRSRSEGR